MIRGKSVYHCHGKRRGKLIKRFKTKTQALKFHRAVMRKKK